MLPPYQSAGLVSPCGGLPLHSLRSPDPPLIPAILVHVLLERPHDKRKTGRGVTCRPPVAHAACPRWSDDATPIVTSLFYRWRCRLPALAWGLALACVVYSGPTWLESAQTPRPCCWSLRPHGRPRRARFGDVRGRDRHEQRAARNHKAKASPTNGACAGSPAHLVPLADCMEPQNLPGPSDRLTWMTTPRIVRKGSWLMGQTSADCFCCLFPAGPS